MSAILNFTLVGASRAKGLYAAVPAHFQDAVDRHQNNLIALSVALKAAGITPVEAAGYVEAALASFQNGLNAAVAEQEEAFREQY